MTLRSVWTGWRNRLLADARFQRWAARFALTRPMARAEAAALFDLTAGFVYSQILLALVESGVLARLAQKPLSEADWARAIGLDDRAAERLARGGCALHLLQRLPDGRLTLGRRGAALLGNPGVLAMIDHHRMLYADLAEPLALLRGQTTPALAGFWDYSATASADAVAPYSALMSHSQHLVAQSVLDAVPLSRGVLLDVGGGEGQFLAAALSRHPRLRGILFDLPAVVERARPLLARFGDRVRLVGGDVFSTPLPRADTLSLIRVLHDHDDPAARLLLTAARAALPVGGRLILAEPMAGVAGAERAADAYFSFYFAAMGRGRTRTPQQITQLCVEAGFTAAQLRPTPLPLMTSVVTAQAH